MSVLETWANPPVLPATVPAGAAVVPAGTPEVWAMTGGHASFAPPADPDADPPVIFRVFDLHDTSEIVLVTDSRTPAWQVVRGDQGTTPVAHRPGFQVHNVITGPGLGGFAQGVPSGNGLVLPAAGRRAVVEGCFTNELFTVSSLPVPAGEAIPGSMWELTAFGYYWTGGGDQRMRAELSWNAPAKVILAQHEWQLIGGTGGFGPPIVPGAPANIAQNTGVPWRLHGLLTFYDAAPATPASGSLLVELAYSTDPTVQHLDLLAGDTTPAGLPVSTTVDASAQMALQLPPNGGGGRVFVQGGKAWRAG